MSFDAHVVPLWAGGPIPFRLAPESFSYSPIVFDNFLTHLVMFLRNREVIGIKISLILFGIFIWRD